MGVELKIGMGRFDALVDPLEHVVDRDPRDLVLVVGKDSIVLDASQGSVKMDKKFGYSFRRTGLEHDVNIVKTGGTLDPFRVRRDNKGAGGTRALRPE